MVVALVGYGLYESFTGADRPGPVRPGERCGRARGSSAARSRLFLLLKGFSSGAVALTGIEAISDGVPAFRRPESKNAANDARAGWRSSSARSSSGSRCSPTASHPYPSHEQTVFSQMGLQVFGDGPLYLVLQIATAAILTLAANTAYADFPRLSSIIARDGFLPRQLANRGDRLVFSNGVLVLAGAAGAAHHRLRRRHDRADPALRGRRVHVVHAVAVGHGASTTGRSASPG